MRLRIDWLREGFGDSEGSRFHSGQAGRREGTKCHYSTLNHNDLSHVELSAGCPFVSLIEDTDSKKLGN